MTSQARRRGTVLPFWALENPVGRIRQYLGPADFYFHPCEYAGWAEDPRHDAYTKKTCLWGYFNAPEKRPVEPVLGSACWNSEAVVAGPFVKYDHLKLPVGDVRSITPDGFAAAFFAANPGPTT